MKIVLNQNDNVNETEVIINCRQADEHILKIISILKASDKKLTGTRNGKTFIVEASEVLYFDTVDSKTFIYTEKEVYETDLRLYELEEYYGGGGFFRSSKSAVINIAKIKSLLPDLGGRLEVTLINGERLLVSRQYAKILKDKLIGGM